MLIDQTFKYILIQTIPIHEFCNCAYLLVEYRNTRPQMESIRLV